MKAYWHNLNERERLTLLIGGVFCTIYLLYMLVYAPLTNVVRDKQTQLTEKQETLRWMQAVHKPFMEKAKKNQQSLTKSKLLTVLAKSLNTSSFREFSYQIQQSGGDDIQLIFEQVPYLPLLEWLWTFSEQYNVVLKLVTIDRIGANGIVKATLVLAAV